MRAIPSTIHSMIKFPTSKGIATLIARPSMVSKCRRSEEKQTVEKPKVEVPQEAEITGEDDVVGTEEVLINPAYPEQLVVIGKGFSKDSRRNLIELLRKNKDVFAWEPTDMTGVPRRLIRHHLNVNISDIPVAQKKRNFSAEKNQVITKEVEEWKKARIVRPWVLKTLRHNT
ncbi:reverse transcriptase domain-containing protein [Artemisia annua]|uniref:Reverse transcriptase domain-containing protein n=1 Tax=Artemisia annua TaxID=35608 RepID=A0A2U1P6B1_ARTAN|nr:reverse transcriptase domain-containing protein [Artemisia annua]